MAKSKLNLKNIVTVDFPSDQYMQTVHPKKQVVFHHTVSGPGAMGDIEWWKQTASRIATCLIIDREGIIHQCFSSKFWAHHLGVKIKQFRKYGVENIIRGGSIANNNILNEQSIGIELDSWGGLTKHTDDKWYPTIGNGQPNLKAGAIDHENVVEYPDGYRGYYAYERYTKKQIKQLVLLLEYLNEKYGIPLTYHDDMWDVSKRALSGEPGVWTHTSYRSDKSDCHKQPDLIEALKAMTA